jgi:hypothetical protein
MNTVLQRGAGCKNSRGENRSGHGKYIQGTARSISPTRRVCYLIFRFCARCHVVMMFQGIYVPDLRRRLYILINKKRADESQGQSTAQTTGIGGHMSGRFIPTVERGSRSNVGAHFLHVKLSHDCSETAMLQVRASLSVGFL